MTRFFVYFILLILAITVAAFMFIFSVEPILQMSALILSIINGLILVYYFFSDKPSLIVSVVHPDIYQWWFKLPDGEYECKKTKKIGFLTYVSIANKGKRTTTLSSWRLRVRSKNFLSEELKPVSVIEPSFQIGELATKAFPVLGQKGIYFDGETVIKSGESISGFAYYVYEFWGHESYGPRIFDKKIIGHFKVEDIFNNKAANKIIFDEKDLDYIKKLIPKIDRMETEENESHLANEKLN